MDSIKTNSRDKMSRPDFKMPDLTQGLYHSNTINKNPAEVYEFTKTQSNLSKILGDLPPELENFLDLTLTSADSVANDSFRVVYTNAKTAKIQGMLTLDMSAGPASKGTVIIAQGKFGNFTTKDEGPSDLMNVFLKRVKAMVETKVLATTNGQPNGEHKH